MRRFSFVLLLTLFIAPLVRAQDTVRFDVPLEAGLTLDYTLESEQAYELEAPFLPGGRQHERWTQTIRFVLDVLEASDEGATLAMTIDEIVIDGSSSLDGLFAFSGHADEEPKQQPDKTMNNRLHTALAPMLGGRFVITIDAERTITDIGVPVGNNGLPHVARGDAYERVLGFDRLREALQPLLRPIESPASIGKGERWEHTFNQRTALGALTYFNEHELDSITGDTARFVMTGDIVIDTQGMGRNLTVDREEYEGEILWNTNDHLATEARTTVDLQYTLSKQPLMQATITGSERIARPDRASTAPDDLAELLEKAAAHFGQPAMAGAIVSGDDIIAIGVAGTRLSGIDLPVTREDRWHLGSCTKAMTAALLAKALADSDEFTMASTLAEIFPEFKGAMNPRYASVTVRDVLAHTASFPPLTSGAAPDRAALEDLSEDPREARLELTERLLTAADSSPYAPAANAGAFLYSNAGYGVAGAITEKLLDQAWEQAMQDMLFAPLGMTSGGFGWPATIDPALQPRGHSAPFGTLRAQDPDDEYELHSAIDPAGDVHCTIGDWARFAQDRLRTLRGEKSPLLPAGLTLALMTPAEGEDYAGGWISAEHPTYGRLYAHDGSAGTFYCSVWLLPDADRAVLVVTNAGSGAEACGAVRDRLLERYAGE